MTDIFLSYARVERPSVEAIRTKLRRMGLDVFFDLEGIDAGAHFPSALSHSLDKARAVFACWSPRYFTREWCLLESREGISKHKIVPIAIQGFDKNAAPVDFQSMRPHCRRGLLRPVQPATPHNRHHLRRQLGGST